MKDKIKEETMDVDMIKDRFVVTDEELQDHIFGAYDVIEMMQKARKDGQQKAEKDIETTKTNFSCILKAADQEIEKLKQERKDLYEKIEDIRGHIVAQLFIYFDSEVQEDLDFHKVADIVNDTWNKELEKLKEKT